MDIIDKIQKIFGDLQTSGLKDVLIFVVQT